MSVSLRQQCMAATLANETPNIRSGAAKADAIWAGWRRSAEQAKIRFLEAMEPSAREVQNAGSESE